MYLESVLKLLILCRVFTPNIACSTVCKRTTAPNVLSVNTGKILVNHSYLNITMTSAMQCGTRCLRQRKCKSINFYPESSWCQLNTESYLTSLPGDIVPHLTAEHYSADQWPQELLGTCRWHNCTEETICLTDPTNVHVRYNCTGECTIISSCVECMPVRSQGGRSFEPVGCYVSRQHNVLPHYLRSFRNLLTDWTDLNIFEGIIMACAEFEATSEYDLFGLEFFGECWAGNVTEAVYPSNEVDILSCYEKCFYGLGSSNHMVVYRWL